MGKKLTILGAIAFIAIAIWGLHEIKVHSPAPISYQSPVAREIHIRPGDTTAINDPAFTYIIESGASVKVNLPVLNGPARNSVAVLRVIARKGAMVEARGAGVLVVAENGAGVVALDGITVDAYGAEVTVYGNATVHAMDGAVINNKGRASNVYAYKGSKVYASSRGRIWAYDGSTVYAKSPPDCDACTQVSAYDGATVYVYDGAEAFTWGATVYVAPGGEVHGTRSTIYRWPGSEGINDPDCKITEMGKDDPVPPFIEPGGPPEPAQPDSP